jgi:flagellar protein FliS
MTASAAELRVMLFDGALKFAARARRGLVEKDYEAVYEGVTRCQDILMELIGALDPARSPDLCRALSALYTFLYVRLMEASRQRSTAIIDEVVKLLEYERETAELLRRQLAGSQPGPAPGGPISVQG